MKIGIFGITANPPHSNHAKAIKHIVKNNKIDEVWVTPVYNHPFNKKFIDYKHRVNMLRIMIKELKNDSIKVKELDKEYYLEKEGVVYSYNLLKYAKEKYGHDFTLLIGADNYKEDVWNKFYKNKEIEDEFGVMLAPDSSVHSTQIREFVKEGSFDKLDGLILPKIKQYIVENKLYKE